MLWAASIKSVSYTHLTYTHTHTHTHTHLHMKQFSPVNPRALRVNENVQRLLWRGRESFFFVVCHWDRCAVDRISYIPQKVYARSRLYFSSFYLYMVGHLLCLWLYRINFLVITFVFFVYIIFVISTIIFLNYTFLKAYHLLTPINIRFLDFVYSLLLLYLSLIHI